MSFEVTIIRNSDGQQIVWSEDDDWNEGSEYRWTEGNQACDCNRRGLFLLACGEDDPDYGDCGNTEFSVILPDGTRHPRARK